MFESVAGNVNFPKLEEEIGRFWRERKIFDLSLRQRKGHPRFVFYEGPPTANGMPHPGHCLTRAIKDLFPRYRTMRGYLCERKAGWDTHGLPVEVEVCKELGIHTKDGGFIWTGQVGTGFTDRMLGDLVKKLAELETDKAPVDDPELRRVKGAHWVRPELVCEVEGLQITSAGKLRAPSFKGLRPDKLSEDAILEN